MTEPHWAVCGLLLLRLGRLTSFLQRYPYPDLQHRTV